VTAFVAVLVDSWRAALASRWMQVLFWLGLLLALFLASISFKSVPLTELVVTRTNDLSRFDAPVASFLFRVRHDDTLGIDPVVARAAAPEDDFPVTGDALVVADLHFRHVEELDRVARRWSNHVARRGAAAHAAPPLPEGDVGRDQRRQFLEERYREFGFEPVYARPLSDDDATWRVAVGAARPHDLVGGSRTTLLFGAATLPAFELSRDEEMVFFETSIADNYSGLFGLLLLIAAWSSAIPDLLQKGRLDLVLARPIGRARLLVHQYFGAVLSTLVVWTFLFSASTLAVGLKTGFWNLAYVGCALTATAMFAVLYPVVIFVGVVLRNSVMGALAAVGFYLLQFLLVAAKQTILGPNGIQEAGVWRRLVDVLYWVVPKASDFSHLNFHFLAKTRLSPLAYSRFFESLEPKVDWWSSAGTSALFAAATLALACLVFARRDW
jgi:ABC-type transport system involved in multi-copper enzyme maturation permease subunit